MLIVSLVAVVFACDDAAPEPSCGDHSLDTGETCDDGNGIDADACTNTCRPAACGDGVLADLAGEGCDDGNTTDGDGCDSTCQARCGDGVPFGDEVCDDGNTEDGDGCRNDCTLPSCGDGELGVDEECDEGPENGLFSACLPDCRNNRCGDGWIHVGVEACETNDRTPSNTFCDPVACVLTCATGFTSCDGPLGPTNGCESELSSANTCGRCDRPCAEECWASVACARTLVEGRQPFGLIAQGARVAWQDGAEVWTATSTSVSLLEEGVDPEVGVALHDEGVYFAKGGKLIRRDQSGPSPRLVFDQIYRLDGRDEILAVVTSSVGVELLRVHDPDPVVRHPAPPDVRDVAFALGAFVVVTARGVLAIDAATTSTLATGGAHREVAGDEEGACFTDGAAISCWDGGSITDAASQLQRARSITLEAGDVLALVGEELIAIPRSGGAPSQKRLDHLEDANQATLLGTSIATSLRDGRVVILDP